MRCRRRGERASLPHTPHGPGSARWRPRRPRCPRAPDGYEAEFRRLYYDTANATHPASMASRLKLVPESQVVFGSDHPYVPIDMQAAALRKLGLPEATVRGIESGTAMGLVPRLKA